MKYRYCIESYGEYEAGQYYVVLASEVLANESKWAIEPPKGGE